MTLRQAITNYFLHLVFCIIVAADLIAAFPKQKQIKQKRMRREVDTTSSLVLMQCG